MRGYFADAAIAHYKEKPSATPISNEVLWDGPTVRASVLAVLIRSFRSTPMLVLHLEILEIVMGHDFPKTMDIDSGSSGLEIEHSRRTTANILARDAFGDVPVE